MDTTNRNEGNEGAEYRRGWSDGYYGHPAPLDLTCAYRLGYRQGCDCNQGCDCGQRHSLKVSR